MAARTVTFPISLIKTRLQYQATQSQYSGFFHAFSKIIKQEKLRGLFKGFLPIVIGTIPTHLAYVSTLEFIRSHLSLQFSWMNKNQYTSQAVRNAIAAGIASAASLGIVVPFDVISQQLMVQDGTVHKQRFSGMFSTIRGVLHQEGWRGFYRGFGATFCVYVPNSCIWWSVYEMTKMSINQYVKFYFPENNSPLDVGLAPNMFAEMISGTIAGATGTIITNPLDVAKTRIQVLNPDPSKSGADGILKTIRNMYREDRKSVV